MNWLFFNHLMNLWLIQDDGNLTDEGLAWLENLITFEGSNSRDCFIVNE